MKSKTEKPGAGAKRATPTRFTGKNKPFPKKPFVKRNPFAPAAKTERDDKPRPAAIAGKGKPRGPATPTSDTQAKPSAKEKPRAQAKPHAKGAPVVRPYGSGPSAASRTPPHAPAPRGPGAPFVSHKPELVARLSLQRERGYLYFVRTTDVCRAPMRRAGEIETVVVGKFTREPGYIYMLNEHGDVVRSKL